nr:hypothetical protein [Tanacetum cinerariifolium]
MMSLLEFGWRVGLYSMEQSSLANTRSGLSRGETIKVDHELLLFWPNIKDDEFFIGGTAIKKVRDPRVRLSHRFIATTISGRKESTHRITATDIFFLYYIYAEGVTYNIPSWLVWYLNGVKDKDFTCRGMFVTRIAKYFGLLTNEMVDALIIKPRAYVFKKKSLIAMKVLLDLGGGVCCWPATRQMEEDDEVEEATNNEAGDYNEMYCNMSRGEW